MIRIIYLVGCASFFFTISADISSHKKYTVLIYMAAANDLLPFVDCNIEQMKRIGSSDQLNILIHLDTHRPHCEKTTQRFIVYKNKLEQVGSNMCMDSGDENTLIDALLWAHKDFPSDHLIMFIWNHGIGPLNIAPHSFNKLSCRPFIYNTQTKMMEIDRSLTYLEHLNEKSRAICFDYTTQTYLTEQKFRKALEVVFQQRNKKIDLICFDACLMASLEVAVNIAPFVNFMTASQEVVPGPGFDYAKILAPLAQENITIPEFAQRIVQTYRKIYRRKTKDFTQSAFNLATIVDAHQNIHKISILLIDALNSNDNELISQALSKARSECTQFHEPCYIDLKHFYVNLLQELQKIGGNSACSNELLAAICTYLQRGIASISSAIIENASGIYFKCASGISIYFPCTPPIHESYSDIHFSQYNAWPQFLARYLQMPQPIKN